MRLRKRHIALALLCVLLWGTCRLPELNFRTPDRVLLRQLRQAGQQQVEAGTLTAAGHHIHYLRAGADTLPLVMVVHGSPGSASACMPFLRDTLLTQKAQVVAPDRPGFGWSDYGRAEPSLQRQAAALAPLLRHAPSPRILVGHSYGGPVVVRLAMDYPELVEGLVIVAGSLAPELEPREWWRAPLDWPPLRWLIPPALCVSNEEIAALYDELRAMEPLWPRVQCPITVIQGEKDRLVPPGNAAYVQRMATHSPRVQVRLLPDGNHFIFWTRYQLVRQSVLELLEG